LLIKTLVMVSTGKAGEMRAGKNEFP